MPVRPAPADLKAPAMEADAAAEAMAAAADVPEEEVAADTKPRNDNGAELAGAVAGLPRDRIDQTGPR